MTYDEAIDYIDNISGLGAKLGLERIIKLLDKLGNPQDNLDVIHVAGTNGKGSTCSMISSILMECGYNVGTYTSPHLEDYNERYTINNVKISNYDFASQMETIILKCKEMVYEGQGHPTVFEVITALAFNYFNSKKIDILVLEVGLGGRFDATNVIKKPLLSIIASIGMDHMDYLGNEISGIAMEKGGIIKNNCPVVLYKQDSLVYNVIKDICIENNSKLYYAENQSVNVISQNLEGTVFSIENEYYSYEDVVLGLLGDYQINNCSTVLIACKALNDIGFKLNKDCILKGLKNAAWMGRMEICGVDPIIILDGAHNADGVKMLSESIVKYFKGKSITLLLGVLGDKEFGKMAECLIPLVNKVVITEPCNTRALSVDNLEIVVSKYILPSYKNKNISKAFDYAKSITGKDEVLCCAGSLYLIGEIHKLCFSKNN